MNHRTVGFANELTKLSGVLGTLLGKPLKMIAKSPMKALTVGSIAIPTIMAAQSARSSSLAGGEKGRYLAASRADGPSESAYLNPNKRKATKKQIASLSRNYKPELFRSAIKIPRK